MAFKIATAGKHDAEADSSKPLGFIGAALFQWVNPKAWVMTMGAVTTYASPQAGWFSFALIGLLYGLVSIPSVGVWAVMGEKLQAFLKDEKKVAIFNRMMGALLVASMVPSIYESYGYFSKI